MAREITDNFVGDPLALRALAHPVRLALLEALTAEETATATRCAELIGESVAGCSYHLRILARHGFIEEVASPGREKPWRRTHLRHSLPRVAASPEQENATLAFAEVFVRREMERLLTWHRAMPGEPGEWQEATATIGSTLWLTAEETHDLRNELTALSERYLPRTADPALRPPGSRTVRLFAATSTSPSRPTSTSPAPASDVPPPQSPGVPR
ncbi:helix-turn-helix domain-containing protein [Streptosporangium sp. 'caverna']|uniref:winged helix-turn-helix domain-containing protein n=1 Tax=Streptosporangium sp. 'caverna' TaxID=2202249 RepID=UPI000D7EA430|nr:helix-turn-helix domain-containing protein [Streptosporangium sp. 'caverna']AWS42037.1 transcriptional regulator [Streptosporangium sp. 'caverna']